MTRVTLYLHVRIVRIVREIRVLQMRVKKEKNLPLPRKKFSTIWTLMSSLASHFEEIKTSMLIADPKILEFNGTPSVNFTDYPLIRFTIYFKKRRGKNTFQFLLPSKIYEKLPNRKSIKISEKQMKKKKRKRNGTKKGKNISEFHSSENLVSWFIQGEKGILGLHLSFLRLLFYTRLRHWARAKESVK